MRILPEYKFVLGQEMEEAVFQALGYASRCWDKDGVFETEKATQVGGELMDIIVQYAQNYTEFYEPDEPAEKIFAVFERGEKGVTKRPDEEDISRMEGESGTIGGHTL